MLCFQIVTGSLRSGTRRINDADFDDLKKKSISSNKAQTARRRTGENMLMEFLHQYGMTISEESKQPWDGNCWYNSLRYYLVQLDGNMTTNDIRQSTMAYFMENESEFIEMYTKDTQPDLEGQEKIAAFKQDIARLKRPGVYQTQSSLCDMIPLAAARAFNVHLEVYDTSIPVVLHFGNTDNIRVIRVGKVRIGNEEHINAVVPFMTVTSTP